MTWWSMRPEKHDTAFEAVIGLEVHAEMETASKMFCACPVVDVLTAEPNTAVCPVCTGMPGVLPVVNEQAVAFALRVALALECRIAEKSIFARKNYFYPDLPKGYQISQYEHPLAEEGRLEIATPQGRRTVRVRRVHLEEDTGKLTHVRDPETGETCSLVDLNRSGVALLEIVSEPDMRSAAEARAYGETLRRILRYLGVNSGDMQKGVIRFEANVSVRPAGETWLGNRVEIKNLNSFRALERAIDYEIARQSEILRNGGVVAQQTVGWDENTQQTVVQRSKEEAHDYRYFPEPDLPPLVVDSAWVEQVRASLPELPQAKAQRFARQYDLPAETIALLVETPATADYYEALAAATCMPPRAAANWLCGVLFSLLNGQSLDALAPRDFAALLDMVANGVINPNTAKSVLAEMVRSGESAQSIVARRGLQQISDEDALRAVLENVLAAHPQQVAAYHAGKETLFNWFFGQAMRELKGRADPQILRRLLSESLEHSDT